jgi:hypothetical protein
MRDRTKIEIKYVKMIKINSISQVQSGHIINKNTLKNISMPIVELKQK